MKHGDDGSSERRASRRAEENSEQKPSDLRHNFVDSKIAADGHE